MSENIFSDKLEKTVLAQNAPKWSDLVPNVPGLQLQRQYWQYWQLLCFDDDRSRGCFIVLHGIACYWIVFGCIVWHCILFHCIRSYCMVLHVISMYCMVLHSITRGCTVYSAPANYRVVHLVILNRIEITGRRAERRKVGFNDRVGASWDLECFFLLRPGWSIVF